MFEDAIGPLLVAAMVAVAGGLGYLVRMQDEHRRWLMQERYEAFLDTIKRAEERSAVQQEWRRLKRRKKDLDEAIQKRADAGEADDQLADIRKAASEAEEYLKVLSARSLSLTTEVSEASVKLRLLGSDDTAARAEALAAAYTATPKLDHNAIRVAERAFLEVARKHLRIRDETETDSAEQRRIHPGCHTSTERP